MSKINNLVQILPTLTKAAVRMQRGLPIALSFDIADFCTLACPYCYWRESTQHKQLDPKQILSIVQAQVDNGIVHATLIGGEPTLRPDVIMEIAKIVPIVWVVTNGMKVDKVMAGEEYKDWDVEDLPKNVSIILSLDGVGEAHDKSRQRKGLYDELKQRFYKTHRSHKVITTTTLHKGNIDEPEKILRDWRDSGIRGCTFEFSTPVGRVGSPEFGDIVGEERNRVIDRLIELKRKYGSFMKNSVMGLNMQRPQNLAKWVGAKNCPTVRFSISFDSLGRIKSPCVLGSNSANPKGKRPDCASCGCHVPTVFEGMRVFDLQTIQSALWFI